MYTNDGCYYLHSSLFFFFKQQTAYEMRISDWSSDVCSSDLGAAERRRRAAHADRRLDAGAAFRGAQPRTAARRARPLHQIGADDARQLVRERGGQGDRKSVV